MKTISNISTRTAHLTASEMRLLDAFKGMHREDRELIIEFALTRAASFSKEKVSHLTLVHGGMQ